MIILKTVTISEEKEVCNFLNKYFPKQKEVCTWNSLLSHDWGKDEPFGYVLIDETRNNVIVGFIATIFANRTIDGKIIKTCSLSTWAVNETFRGKGLSMVSKLTKRKNILFLNFSANGISRKIFEFYGFKTLEKEVWTFFSCPILNKKKTCILF